MLGTDSDTSEGLNHFQQKRVADMLQWKLKLAVVTEAALDATKTSASPLSKSLLQDTYEAACN